MNFRPGFQIQFDGFAQVSTSTFDIVALRGDARFRAASNVKLFFFGAEDRESVMLALQA